MTKSILLILFAFITFSSAYSQGFDYQETPYEIGVDIIPIFGGNNPYSLFLRKNYQTASGKNRAWRATLRGSNTNMYSDTPIYNNFDRMANHNVGLSIGKEFQKIVTDKIIVYTGLDLGFDYSSRKYTNEEPPSSTDGLLMVKNHTYYYTATLFSGVKYHITPRFSLFAEFGLEGSYSRALNVVERGAFNFLAGKESNLTQEQIIYHIIPLRSLRVAYHF